jgi:hypothetical protein
LTLCFFQIDTPSLARRNKVDVDAAADGAAGGSNPCLQYSLFLPDPDSMDRLGSAPAEAVYESLKGEAASEAAIVLVDPKTVIPAAAEPPGAAPRPEEAVIDASDLVQVPISGISISVEELLYTRVITQFGTRKISKLQTNIYATCNYVLNKCLSFSSIKNIIRITYLLACL